MIDADAAALPAMPPPPWTGRIFPEPIDFTEAPDLGHVPAPVPDSERRPAGAIVLRDVAEEAGLGDALGGGNLHGVGVAFADLNDDGLPDVFLANGCNPAGSIGCIPQRLFVNDGDGTFSDATESSGLAEALTDAAGEPRDLYSVAGADYDADGDLDLYVTSHPRDLLLRNVGGGRFEDATALAGAGGPVSDPSQPGSGGNKLAAFGDIDSDGRLDLLVASSSLPRRGIYVLRNLGDGTFENVTSTTRGAIHAEGNPCALMWSDYDDDADLDVWIWNDRGGHVLLNNDGAVLADVAAGGATGTRLNHPMGIDGADVDRDLDLDYYVSGISNNKLIENLGDGTLLDASRESDAGGFMGQYGWGLGFEDFDGDGWFDIFVGQEDERDHVLYRNLGEAPARFERSMVPHPPPRDTRRAHNVPVAFADFDGDGRVDVLTSNTSGERVQLYRNETDVGSHRSLQVRLPRGGGARVAVSAGGVVQFREIAAGSSRGSQNDLSARFGLGDYTGAEWVAARWPDGRVRAIRNVAAGVVVFED